MTSSGGADEDPIAIPVTLDQHALKLQPLAAALKWVTQGRMVHASWCCAICSCLLKTSNRMAELMKAHDMHAAASEPRRTKSTHDNTLTSLYDTNTVSGGNSDPM
jgi:hypothetical protein